MGLPRFLGASRNLPGGEDRRTVAAASSGEVMAQLKNRSERLDMEALIDENGLGAFNVILVNAVTQG